MTDPVSVPDGSAAEPVKLRPDFERALMFMACFADKSKPRSGEEILRTLALVAGWTFERAVAACEDCVARGFCAWDPNEN